MIFILTAPVQSGKTTSLLQWAAQRNDVQGILTPVIAGRRVFINAATKEQFDMEAAGDEEVLTIGRFAFSKAAFEKAAQIIRDAVDKEGWLVIDEIGPLELKGEGFCDVLKEVLKERTGKMILVIREGLTETIKEFFHFSISTITVNNAKEIISGIAKNSN